MNTPPTLPAQFSEIMNLSSAQAVFPVRTRSKWGSVVTAVFCFGGAALALAGGYFLAMEAVGQHGVAVFQREFMPFLILAGIAALAGLFAAISALNNWRKAVVIYQNGFAYSDWKGVKAWRWDQVESITAAVTKHYYNGIYTGTTHIYTLRSTDGERIQINDVISKVEDVVARLRGGFYPLLYPKYAQAYNSGQTVSFGPLSFSKAEGIRIGKKSYAWNEVAEVKIQQGVVSIAKQGGGWFSGASAAASTIPNLELMLELVNQIVGVKTSR